jgi:hypothetical protein
MEENIARDKSLKPVYDSLIEDYDILSGPHRSPVTGRFTVEQKINPRLLATGRVLFRVASEPKYGMKEEEEE